MDKIRTGSPPPLFTQERCHQRMIYLCLLLPQILDKCYHVGRVNSHNVWLLVMFPKKYAATLQCYAESVERQGTRN